jgi:hypothetical protein
VPGAGRRNRQRLRFFGTPAVVDLISGGSQMCISAFPSRGGLSGSNPIVLDGVVDVKQPSPGPGADPAASVAQGALFRECVDLRID